jgi:hypothetical protein
MRTRTNEHGSSYVELLVAASILATACLVLVGHLASSWNRTTFNRERIFAYEKATSILAEMQAFVDRGEAASASDLDTFDDGVTTNDVLTIARLDGKELPPDHELSGNAHDDGIWKWTRQISVRPFGDTKTRDVRLVTVRMFRRDSSSELKPYAEVMSVIRSIGTAYPTTQVYDVYLLAIENVPGWWVYMDSIQPFIEATITDLEGRNPGLELRTHWITKLSYGRDRQYAPYTNAAKPSTDAMPGAYIYPGLMPEGSSAARYYVPELFDARVNIDGTITNDYDATDNPHPYALADQFNHCMRLEDERALFEARVEAGLEDPKEPTWRLLLEDMISDPDKFHNAILINLHGELLPMPPMRNFSDAAKDPASNAGQRVVTHPERLRYVRAWHQADKKYLPGDSEDVALRVYAYKTDPDEGEDFMVEPITVQIHGVDLTEAINDGEDPSLVIECLQGGPTIPGYDEDLNGESETYQSFATAPAAPRTGRGAEMYYEAEAVYYTNPGGDLVPQFTLLTLYNTPLVTPAVGAGGLGSGWRLYGYEYIPCSVESAGDFSVDLASTVDSPKNTARWRIRIPATILDKSKDARRDPLVFTRDAPLAVTTRIGSDLTSGDLYPTPMKPTNRSQTYVYWTEDVQDVPFTERYQYVGDPRHCPYADLKDGGASFPNGYNWFFDNFNGNGYDARSRWPGFAYKYDGWSEGMEFDVARMFQTIRTALVRTEALYTTLTGWSYYYMSLGGDIGYDSANGFSKGIPVDGAPYGSGSDVNMNSIINSAGDSAHYGAKIIRTVAESGDPSDDYWWSRSWLGELYPDDMYYTWEVTGNLPAGSGQDQFFRDRREDIASRYMPRGTDFVRALRRTGSKGCSGFYHIGTNSNSTFNHTGKDGKSGDLVEEGLEVAGNYGFPVPNRARISRPFDLTTSASVAPDFNVTSVYPRFSASIVARYFDHDSSGWEGSALIRLDGPDQTDHLCHGKTAFIVMNGIDRTTETGSAFIAKYSLLTLVHSFFEAGSESVDAGVRFNQLPRVIIRSPTDVTSLDDPKTIDIKWDVNWERWDGQKYTEDTSTEYALDESGLEYVLMYSPDNGVTWLHMIDDSVANPGTKPEDASVRFADEGTGQEKWVWSVDPEVFKEGSYLIRIDTYRQGEILHYAQHSEKIYIDR